jgi:uncharacterized membrane protein YbaN (DUF454 family)
MSEEILDFVRSLETWRKWFAGAAKLSNMIIDLSEEEGFKTSELYLATLIIIADFHVNLEEKGFKEVREWGLERLKDLEETMRRVEKE